MNPPEIELRIEQIRPLLAGLGSEIQGAILADLVAISLAGHIVIGDPRATSALRERLLRLHIETVRKLVPVNERMIHGDEES